MKYIVLILFLACGLQNDTIKVDTVYVPQLQQVDKMNNKLDSIIAILKKDTINNKKH